MDWTHLFIALVVALMVVKYYSKSDGRDILTEKADAEYDYVIVGGGTAGSVLASRLAEDETRTVLLLEAGGFYDESTTMHVPSDWMVIVKSKYTWDYYTTPQKHSGKALVKHRSSLPRGRVLGGTSVINAMQYTRGSPFDYDEWAANGCTGWSYDDVLPYFLKSEDIQIPHLRESEYHGSGGPVGVSSGTVTELASVFLEAGKELGYNVTDYNSRDIVGFSESQTTTRNGVRESMGVAYLGRKGNMNNLHIVLNSYVTKIHIINKVAHGVSFIRDNKKHYVRARREVIVSAGAINSPQLLMLSGIGPREHLKNMGIPVIADLPVGENLQDHVWLFLSNNITMPLSVNFDWMNSVWTNLQYKIWGTGVKSNSGIQATAFVHTDNSKIDSTYPDLMFMFLANLFTSDATSYFQNFENSFSSERFTNNPTAHGFTTGIILTHPKSKGTIRLKSADPFDYPVIDPRYLKEISDVKQLIEGIRLWEKIVRTNAIKQLGATEEEKPLRVCSQHEFRSDEYWECFVRHVALAFNHHCCTCKMGADNDAAAVVDPELRVRGIKGLRVVDASVLHKITSGNTAAPVIMVAEKAADLIQGKDKSEHSKL